MRVLISGISEASTFLNISRPTLYKWGLPPADFRSAHNVPIWEQATLLAWKGAHSAGSLTKKTPGAPQIFPSDLLDCNALVIPLIEGAGEKATITSRVEPSYASPNTLTITIKEYGHIFLIEIPLEHSADGKASDLYRSEFQASPLYPEHGTDPNVEAALDALFYVKKYEDSIMAANSLEYQEQWEPVQRKAKRKLELLRKYSANL